MSKAFKIQWVWPSWAKQAFRRFSSIAVPAALALTLLAAGAASWLRTFEIYELQTYDWRCRLLPHSEPFHEVLLVDISDDALTEIGRWPFGREYHAVLLQALREYGAAAAAFDILFSEPSASDEEFAQSSAAFKKAFYSEALINPESRGGKRVSVGMDAALLDVLKQGAGGVGAVNAIVDPDGKIRRLAPVIWVDGKPRFHLSVLLAMERLGVKPDDVRFGRDFIDLGGKVRVPIDENGDTLIRFAGKWSESFEHASYLRVLVAFRQALAGETMVWDLNRLKDRVCIIGLTATASHDMNPVPIEPRYPQVGIYANFFENMMKGTFLTRVDRVWNLLLAVLLAAAAWGISRIRRLSLSVAAATLVSLGFAGAVVACFVWALKWIDLFYPTLLYWTFYLSAIVWRTMQEKRKRELLETELSIASKIQRSFLPSALPAVDGYEMEVFMRPAKHVGGDLYAALKIDESHLGIMCGDVSGKGMPAALFMARSVAEFKFCAAGGFDPAETLRRLNNGLADAESSGLFVTMNYAVVDLKEKKFLLSNGGHMPVVRIRKNGESELLSPDGGMPIGLVPDVDFGRLETPLEPGDVFLMYSDGISEARNRKIQDFEIERVTATATQWRSEPASGICARILEAVELFVGGAPQHDDMTLFVFKVRD